MLVRYGSWSSIVNTGIGARTYTPLIQYSSECGLVTAGAGSRQDSQKPMENTAPVFACGFEGAEAQQQGCRVPTTSNQLD